jgi:hypothetical protein
MAKKTTTVEKKTGLRKPQVRILSALSKARGPLNRAAIASKADVDVAGMVEHIGSSDPAKRKANDAKHWPSLLSLGFVKEASNEEEGGGSVYEITAAGKKALAEVAK